MKKKTNKAYKKMTAEQLQGLMHLRRRDYIKQNAKAYTRKVKHKGKESE
jgi:hypothetical protein